MRVNKYLAQASNLSRRGADTAVQSGRVRVNGELVQIGDSIQPGDSVTLDGNPVSAPAVHQTIMLHKPAGYVCSRAGQGSRTIYELLPSELRNLKPVGRLDKDTSGLLLLTDDGDLAHSLTHPSFQKQKIYEVTLDSELMPRDFERITGPGVKLDDGLSSFGLDYINDDNFKWKITMHEGRNRQIRRTFEKLGYKVLRLHRTHFGPHKLATLPPGEFATIK